MSFMFNPSPYNEKSAVNRPALSKETVAALTCGTPAIGRKIFDSAVAGKKSVIAFEGYPGADFVPMVNIMSNYFCQSGIATDIINAADYYRSPEELETAFSPLLPEDREKDPVLLFGRVIEGGYENIFDAAKYIKLLGRVKSNKEKGIITLLHGFGSAYSDEILELIDIAVYFDIAPKEAVLRAKNGRMKNIGDKTARNFKALMRRCYYIDFEISLKLRRKLIEGRRIDFYIDYTVANTPKMLPKSAFSEVTERTAKMPFRCKPVYIEGVWGGQYVKKLRNVSNEMKNIAWVFDLIPMEVSIVVDMGGEEIEIPYYTFLQAQGGTIMGKKCLEKFGGYFPLRFNYDDTFHSSGNMSIQVHSGAEYNRANFNEFGRQDESYYVVVAGHDAKTYLGFNDGIDPNEFIAKAKESEKKHNLIDYQKYIHSVDSKPGVQVMIPAGTIHASGRNQVILEIGSLTIGSYTYKMYDYLRFDLDGHPRPIHTYHGENVLKPDRNAEWVHKNIVQQPQTIREGDGFCEKIVGECDLLYFSLRHLEFEKSIEDDTDGKFHVLTLVDGEKVVVRSAENPELCYYQNYLDIIVVPANVGKYVIENLGKQPVIIHKTCLKDGFENDRL